MDTASAAPSAPSQAAPSAPTGGEASAAQATESKGIPSSAQTAEMYELKVNGRDVKLSRDELIKKAQLGYSAHEKFEQSAQQRRQVEAIVGKFKTSPIEALMDPALGLTKDQVRTAMEAWYMKEFIEPEQMTPEQKRLRDAEEELSKYREAEKLKEKEAADREFEALTQKEREVLQKQITEALDSSGLPKTRFIVSRMAYYMHKNLANGWDAPMEVIIDQVKRERQENLSDLTENSDAEALIAYLGDKVINKIRKYDLQRLRAKKNGGVDPDNAINVKARESKGDDKGPTSYRDVSRNLRKIIQGK